MAWVESRPNLAKHQSCPSSLSSISGHLLPFLLTMEQTKKAGLETGVSSHLVLHNSGAPARAKRARSGAPWVRNFGKLSIPENLVMT